MPAWVGSEAALFSVLAVMAWSIVLLAMNDPSECGGTFANRDPEGKGILGAGKRKMWWRIVRWNRGRPSSRNEKAGVNPGLS
ncbi:hypothetical protein GCM10007923_09030 [Shinella yambaruensis]|uniref:Uncharacterized protein n=1 Tax=Shinella yambaruensis TaxID=415996 RepID=A0ABQ5ZFN8_9HYPH|nr:hypothetical protein GCM10007923_09030 [Shinella yambaruensis]